MKKLINKIFNKKLWYNIIYQIIKFIDDIFNWIIDNACIIAAVIIISILFAAFIFAHYALFFTDMDKNNKIGLAISLATFVWIPLLVAFICLIRTEIHKFRKNLEEVVNAE